MHNKNWVGKTVLTVLLIPNFAWAQIVYQPAAATGVAIPTLTTTALVLAILLLVVAAKWAGFNRNKHVGKIIGVLGVCAIASGIVSVKMISDAYAGGGGGTNFGFLSSPSGGSAPIIDGVLNIFENTSGTDQQLVSINTGLCPDTDNGPIDGVGQCIESAVITTDENGLCYTDCRPVLIEN